MVQADITEFSPEDYDPEHVDYQAAIIKSVPSKTDEVIELFKQTSIGEIQRALENPFSLLTESP